MNFDLFFSRLRWNSFICLGLLFVCGILNGCRAERENDRCQNRSLCADIFTGSANKPLALQLLQLGLPNEATTPGSLCSEADPNFSEFRYSEQIPVCKRNVSRAKKLRIAQAYGVPESDFSNYEFDHYIPLSIGGSDNEDNLWPQPRDDQNSLAKDKLEYDLFLKISGGTIAQEQAVDAIKSWRPVQISSAFKTF